MKELVDKLLKETVTEIKRLEEAAKENPNWANPSRMHWLDGRREALEEIALHLNRK